MHRIILQGLRLVTRKLDFIAQLWRSIRNSNRHSNGHLFRRKRLGSPNRSRMPRSRPATLYIFSECETACSTISFRPGRSVENRRLES